MLKLININGKFKMWDIAGSTRKNYSPLLGKQIKKGRLYSITGGMGSGLYYFMLYEAYRLAEKGYKVLFSDSELHGKWSHQNIFEREGIDMAAATKNFLFFDNLKITELLKQPLDNVDTVMLYEPYIPEDNTVFAGRAKMMGKVIKQLREKMYASGTTAYIGLQSRQRSRGIRNDDLVVGSVDLSVSYISDSVIVIDKSIAKLFKDRDGWSFSSAMNRPNKTIDDINTAVANNLNLKFK